VLFDAQKRRLIKGLGFFLTHQGQAIRSTQPTPNVILLLKGGGIGYR